MIIFIGLPLRVSCTIREHKCLIVFILG